MGKKLLQLHWQFGDGRTEMKSQQEIGSGAEMRAFEKDVQARHPLPEGAQWLICNEESEHFVKTVA